MHPSTSTPATDLTVWLGLIDGTARVTVVGAGWASRTSSRGQSGPVLVSIYPYPAYGAAVPVGSGPGGRRGAIGDLCHLGGDMGGTGVFPRRGSAPIVGPVRRASRPPPDSSLDVLWLPGFV